MPTISPDLWLRFISAGVVPVVLVSACGLLCLAFYNRLAAIVGRLRAFEHQMLKDQESLVARAPERPTARLARERLRASIEILDRQSQALLGRARLIRRTLYSLLSAIASLLLCSMTIAASVFRPELTWVAGPFFLAGLGLILAAITFAMRELHVALDPVELGTEFAELMLNLIPDAAEARGAEEGVEEGAAGSGA